jgi:hypothetical protein
MHWGFLALVFIVSVAIGAARKPRRTPAPTLPPEDLN